MFFSLNREEAVAKTITLFRNSLILSGFDLTRAKAWELKYQYKGDNLVSAQISGKDDLFLLHQSTSQRWRIQGNLDSLLIHMGKDIVSQQRRSLTLKVKIV